MSEEEKKAIVFAEKLLLPKLQDIFNLINVFTKKKFGVIVGAELTWYAMKEKKNEK